MNWRCRQLLLTNRLNELEAECLEMMFTEVLLALGIDKAFGLDGFIVEFWVFSWEVVKK